MEGYEGKGKVANLFHSFHRTFHLPKRVVKRVISSIIIIYICLHTKQSYEGSRRFIYTFVLFLLISGKEEARAGRYAAKGDTCRVSDRMNQPETGAKFTNG